MLYEDRVARFRWNVPRTFNFASDVIDLWAEDRSRVALYAEDDRGRELRLTFSDLAGQSARFANALRGLGIRRGDPVLIALPAVPEWPVAVLAALRLGALVVSAPATLRAPELAFRLRETGARAVVAARPTLGEIDDVRSECPALEVFVGAGAKAPAGWRPFAALLRDASRRLEPVPTASDEPALVFFASQASGDPRAVVHAHAWTWAQRYAGEAWLDSRSTDLHWATAAPGGTRAASGALFAPWSLGVPIFLHDGRFRARRWLALLEKHAVSTLSATPGEYRQLLRADPGGYDLSRLRHATATGEPLAASEVLAGKERLGLTIHDGYARTETMLLVANVEGLPVRPGSMGKPFPGHDVRVIDGDGSEVPVGEIGEIAVRKGPPSLLQGYRSASGTIEPECSGDWLRTGDRARRDEQGYFWFHSRADDVIVAGGHRIGPTEVERVLLTHPAVLEAAAVASPGRGGGASLRAFVRLRDGGAGSATLAREILRHVRDAAAVERCPSTIAFVNGLPRSEDGSIRRADLRRPSRRRPGAS